LPSWCPATWNAVPHARHAFLLAAFAASVLLRRATTCIGRACSRLDRLEFVNWITGASFFRPQRNRDEARLPRRQRSAAEAAAMPRAPAKAMIGKDNHDQNRGKPRQRKRARLQPCAGSGHPQTPCGLTRMTDGGNHAAIRWGMDGDGSPTMGNSPTLRPHGATPEVLAGMARPTWVAGPSVKPTSTDTRNRPWDADSPPRLPLRTPPTRRAPARGLAAL